MEDLSYCLNCGIQLPTYHKVGPRRKYCNSTSCNAQGRKKKITVHFKKYQYSKWGGVNRVLQHVQIADTWYCQSCKQEQPKQIPAYRFPFEGEYLRICPTCHHAVVLHAIDNFFEIVDNL